MRQTRFLIAAAFLYLAIAPGSLLAGIKDRPYSLHFSYGAAQPALNDSAQMWLVSQTYGGHFQYMISPQTGFVVAAAYSKIYNDSTSSSILKLDKARANRKWSNITASVGPKFYLNRRKGFAPFISMTADLAVWKISMMADDKPVLVLAKSDAVVDYSAWELGGTVGLGFEKLIDNRLGFSLEADFTYLTGVNTDFAQSVVNARSRGLFRIMAGLSLNFGGAPRSLLREWEGRDSYEPPSYARRVYLAEIDCLTGDTFFVDQSRTFAGEGFSPAQQPQILPEEDSDLDGIGDQFDKCPDTPEGALVNGDGCPHDADGDGVVDGVDNCPDTPRQARGDIDEYGCLSDTDRDDVPDYLDKCTDTPLGIGVDQGGCPFDADHDGVIDAVDRCRQTPPQVEVDDWGCPDYPSYFYTRILRVQSGGGMTRSPEIAATLDSIVALLKLFPEVTAAIFSFSDDEGPDEANLQQTQQRADAIKKYLVLQGITTGRLSAVGEGEAHPIDTNRTAAGRERNRRIEIEFRFP